MATQLDWIERYDVRSERGTFSGWAIIHIDSAGFLGVVSDYGNYAYHWSSFGDDFKRFLSGLDWEYLYRKLTHEQNVYDGEATLRSIENELGERLRSNDMSDEQHHAERELLDRLKDEINHSPCGFAEWMRDTEMSDVHELAEYTTETQCRTFCEKVWPRFIAALKEGKPVPLRSQA